ncbi:MAG: hypothetical protein KDD33_11995 [Bdellovibrionales bacterium]|nr:hypothetical protein [Bdellovibrionales bacterium]
MKQAALSYFTNNELSLIALILFLIAFSFLIFRLYFWDPKSKYDKLAQIPLEDKEATDGRR